MISSNSDRGIVLITIAATLAVCSLLTALTLTFAWSTITILKEASVSDTRSEEELANLTKLVPPTITTKERFICLSKSVKKNESKVSECRFLTSSGKLPQYIDKRSALFPLLDLSLIFSNALDCSLEKMNIPHKLLNKYSLTPGSSHSIKDCLLPSDFSLSLTSLNNISADNLGLLTNSSLISAGTIEIKQTLDVDRSLLIISGGDIAISQIRAKGTSQSRVTLISLTGAVIVEKISGPVSLSVIAWEGGAVPTTPFLSEYPLPSFIKTFTLGRNRI